MSATMMAAPEKEMEIITNNNGVNIHCVNTNARVILEGARNYCVL